MLNKNSHKWRTKVQSITIGEEWLSVTKKKDLEDIKNVL